MGRFTLRDEGKTIAIGKVLRVVESGTGATASSGAGASGGGASGANQLNSSSAAGIGPSSTN